MKLVSFVAAVLATAAAGVDERDFRWERTLNGPDRRLLAFVPDGPLYAHAKLDLADLRILDARGRQVPWRPRPEQPAMNTIDAVVLNAGRRGRGFAALIDLGPRRVIRNRLELSFGNATNFVGSVTVSGSDNRENFTRLSTTTVYDLHGARAARSTSVVFPPTDHRFLRLEGRNLPTPDAARASTAPRAATLRPVAVKSTTRREGTKTRMDLDLAWEKVPVDVLQFRSTTARFDREVEVRGSNGGAYIPVASGRVLRLPGASLLRIPVSSRQRKLRVVIDNGDDEPLRALGITPLARTREVLLANGYRPPFRLLYGNRALDIPEYDFASLPPIALRPVARGTLSAERANPDLRAAEDTRSFFARNSWLVEAGLVLAALAVAAGGVLALRRRA